MSIEAVILAGGKSTRMGTDKGLLEINGKAMVKYLIDTISSLEMTLSISTSDKTYIKFGQPVITDQYSEIGPLGGLHSGLKNSKNNAVLIVSVDAPFLTKDCISKLIQHLNLNTIIISSCEESRYPLIGIYPTKVLSGLERHIENGGRSVFGFLESQEVIDVQFSNNQKDCFRNINSLEDLYRVRK